MLPCLLETIADSVEISLRGLGTLLRFLLERVENVNDVTDLRRVRRSKCAVAPLIIGDDLQDVSEIALHRLRAAVPRRVGTIAARRRRVQDDLGYALDLAQHGLQADYAKR